jgi:tetratricopeptide (TPR) repeat protein
MDAYDGWSEDPETSLDTAFRAAERSLSIDPNNPETHALLAMVNLSHRKHDRALAQSEKATTLGPSNSKALGISAIVASCCGEPRQAIILIRRAMRLCPIYPAWYPGTLAEAYFLLKQLDETMITCETSVECDPDYIHARITLAMALAEAGRMNEARAAADEVLRIEPTFSIGAYARAQPYRNDEVLVRMVDGLRAAGLPD